MPETPNVCEHLKPMLDHLIASGAKIVFAGQAWSDNCRMWVYFDILLPIEELKRQFPLAPCVQFHTHRGTHDGQETGFVCNEHHDGIMGRYHEDLDPKNPLNVA